jgi:hypothetical protein
MKRSRTKNIQGAQVKRHKKKLLRISQVEEISWKSPAASLSGGRLQHSRRRTAIIFQITYLKENPSACFRCLLKNDHAEEGLVNQQTKRHEADERNRYYVQKLKQRPPQQLSFSVILIECVYNSFSLSSLPSCQL